MKRFQLVLIILLLLFHFFLLDFPGAKIALYALIAVIIFNKIFIENIRKNLNIRRFMDTHRVFSGLSELTSLIISNDSPFPVHAIQITDYSDLNISVQQSHQFFFSLKSGENRLESYPIHGRKRGKYIVGPSTVRFNDLINLFSFAQESDTTKEIIVFPTLYNIANMPFKSMQPYGAIKNPMPIFEDPSLISGMREYQFGDEIKNINWKVSARFDKLYVNTHQPSISSASLIMLNLMEDEFQFRNRDYYIEQSISIAASLVKKLFLYKQEVGLISNCRMDKIDSTLFTGINKGEAHFTNILTELAVIEANKKIPFKNLLDPSELGLSWGTSLYILTPRLDEVSLFRLVDLYQGSHSITIINTGPEINRELSLWNIGFASYYAEIDGNIIRLIRM